MPRLLNPNLKDVLVWVRTGQINNGWRFIHRGAIHMVCGVVLARRFPVHHQPQHIQSGASMTVQEPTVRIRCLHCNREWACVPAARLEEEFEAAAQYGWLRQGGGFVCPDCDLEIGGGQ